MIARWPASMEDVFRLGPATSLDQARERIRRRVGPRVPVLLAQPAGQYDLPRGVMVWTTPRAGVFIYRLNGTWRQCSMGKIG